MDGIFESYLGYALLVLMFFIVSTLIAIVYLLNNISEKLLFMSEKIDIIKNNSSNIVCQHMELREKYNTIIDQNGEIISSIKFLESLAQKIIDARPLR